MKDSLKFILRSFFAGCFGCLGAWFTTLAIVVLVAALAGPTLMRVLPPLLLPVVSDQGSSRPTPQPTPEGQLPALAVWLTLGQDMNAAPVTSIPKDQLPQVHVWVSSDQHRSVPFQLWLSGPMGNDYWGPELNTSESGEPTLAGQFATAMLPGKYTLEAKIGDTVVGSQAFTVTE